MPTLKFKGYKIAVTSMAIAFLSGSAIADSCDPDRFEASVPGTVKDVDSGLMWKACSEGLLFYNGSCWDSKGNAEKGVEPRGNRAYQYSGFGGARYQAEAVNASAGNAQNFGFTDWRIPSLAEMRTLVDDNCETVELPSDLFPNILRYKLHWTRTTISAGGTPKVWAVSESSGDASPVGSKYNDPTQHLRLVRTDD